MGLSSTCFSCFFQEKNRSDPSLRAAADGKSAVARDTKAGVIKFPKNFSHRGSEVEYANITIMPICQSTARRCVSRFRSEPKSRYLHQTQPTNVLNRRLDADTPTSPRRPMRDAVTRSRCLAV